MDTRMQIRGDGGVRRIGRLLAIALAATLAAPGAAQAQWVTTYEQFYLQAPHNWEFRNQYQAADRLFNAFDYGHAILYEKLWTQPDAPASLLEETEYDFLTKKVLVRPPRVPLEEGAIEIKYVQLAPEAKQMFEWAHILHRQMYDVLADESLSEARKDAEVARLIGYYKTRPELAFSSKPKSMALMQEQPYSLAFRQQYPKFNGLIWGYHWLQVGLYEPLLVGRTVDERQAGVRATVARFWQMLADAPRTMPHQMPMTAAVSPRFAERYAEAAIIFDNLHSMHDVISDILANDAVPRDRKRAEILRAAELFRDDTSYVMTEAAWRAMAGHMGAENMGGPAVGFLPELPTPTVTYGAVMTHDDQTGAMTGFKYGSATGGAHAGHDMPAAPAAAAAPSADPHAGHNMPTSPPAVPDTAKAAAASGGAMGHAAMQGAMHGAAHDSMHASMHGAAASAADSADVARAVLAYHAALGRGDSTAALALLAPEAIILETGGSETVAEYRAHHLPSDIAFARAVRETRSPIAVTVRGEMAWATSTSVAEGTFRDRAVDSAGAELMVLTRTPAGWRITAIHWSSRRRD